MAADWTVKELKILKDVLTKIAPDNVDNIKPFFPCKTKDQLKYMISKSRNFYEKGKKRRTEAPIECWIAMVSQLVFRDDVDHSENLARVMSLISEFEEFNSGEEEEFKPNYKLIYHYLSEVLLGNDPLPPLPSVECAIILDLMQSLVDVLRTKNTAVHQQIMQWKYKLLTSRINIYDKAEQWERFKKVFTNDFSDLLKSSKHSNVTESERQTSTNSTSAAPSKSPGITESESQRTLNVTSQPETSRKGQKRKMVDNDQGNSSTQVDFDENPVADANNELCEEQDSDSEDKHFSKPILFTLNPFCIPVSLLKLKDVKK